MTLNTTETTTNGQMNTVPAASRQIPVAGTQPRARTVWKRASRSRYRRWMH